MVHDKQKIGSKRGCFCGYSRPRSRSSWDYGISRAVAINGRSMHNTVANMLVAYMLERFQLSSRLVASDHHPNHQDSLFASIAFILHAVPNKPNITLRIQ
jgi:hypothetical protein